MRAFKNGSELTEEDILDRLRDDAKDDHRNYIYPDQAQAILDLLKKKDDKISELVTVCQRVIAACDRAQGIIKSLI